MNKVYKEKGFTLLEVIIASTLSIGVAIVMMNLAKNQNKINRTTSAQSDIADIHARAKYLLSKSDLCTATLNQLSKPLGKSAKEPNQKQLNLPGIFAPPTGTSTIPELDPIIVPDPNKKFGTVSLVDITAYKNDSSSAYVELHFSLDKNSDNRSTVGSNLKVRRILVNVEFDADGEEVVDCSLDGRVSLPNPPCTANQVIIMKDGKLECGPIPIDPTMTPVPAGASCGLVRDSSTGLIKIACGTTSPSPSCVPNASCSSDSACNGGTCAQVCQGTKAGQCAGPINCGGTLDPYTGIHLCNGGCAVINGVCTYQGADFGTCSGAPPPGTQPCGGYDCTTGVAGCSLVGSCSCP